MVLIVQRDSTLVLRSEIQHLRFENQSLRDGQQEIELLRDENRRLRPLQDEVLGFRKEYRDWRQLREDVDQLRGELTRIRKESEVLRLQALVREEVRGASPEERMAVMPPAEAAAELGASKPEPLQAVSVTDQKETYLRKTHWKNVGILSPEATAQTYFWAMREGDYQVMSQCLSPRQHLKLNEALETKTIADVLTEAKKTTETISAIRLVDRHRISANEVVIGVLLDGASAGKDPQMMAFKRFGNLWKLDGTQ